MKSFLGLASYFRDHIEHHSDIVKPLHDMIPGGKKYSRYKKLNWNQNSENAFALIQDKINNCPTLFFMDPKAKIFLHTDASKTGVGAYLFQVNENEDKEYPVAFVSKSLSGSALNWDTLEKETFAIFYAVTTLEHLLRDVKFTLMTDHKNLVFLNTDLREKVKRWKVAIQSFDFDIKYIKGVDNTVADYFSRITHPLSDDLQERIQIIEELSPLPKEIYDTIKKVHNTTVGHRGFDRTLDSLLQTNHKWKGMRQDIKTFIRRCPCCQKMSQLKLQIHSHPFTLASYGVMDKVNIDTIGPLPPDSIGNTHIVVIIDCFTRFVELFPVKDTTALAAAKCLLHFTGRYGIPARILTDNGTQYYNSLIKELTNLLMIDHFFTHPYSKEENAIVERANKEVLRHLKAIIFHSKIIDSWADYLPLVQRIMNAQVHSSIGLSPAEILFGNSVNLDRGLIFPYDDIPSNTKFSEWIGKMIKTQKDLVDIAIKAQNAKDEFHIANFSNERTEFPINSYVLVNYETGDHIPPTKFHTNLKGPYRVVSHTDNKNVYTVQNLVTNKNEDFHVKLLHPYLTDSNNETPRQVANTDSRLFDVEEILKHRGNPKQKLNMKFQVKWTGILKPTWEPWKHLRDNAIFHNYLKHQKLSRLIPHKFKRN
jgi:transposase InsO family protein